LSNLENPKTSESNPYRIRYNGKIQIGEIIYLIRILRKRIEGGGDRK
jgi:hypothetical protein